MPRKSLQRQPTLEDVKAERCRRSFRLFLEEAWPHIESSAFVPGWHIDAICEHLQAVAERRIRHLQINISPRCSKSTITSIAFPAWIWLTHPEKRFMMISYSLRLSTRDNVKCRDLIRSKWYQDRWGHLYQLKSDQDQKERYDNDKGGSRVVSSIGSQATGEGAEIVISDDSNSTEESDEVRRNTLNWWDSVMPTRLNDPKTGSFINIQQRSAANDLTGHLISKGGYELLKIPMEYEGEPNPTSIGYTDPRTQIGELMCPARFGPDEVAFLKRELGAFKSAGQLQQSPKSRTGNMIDSAWFKEWSPLTLPQAFDEHLISVDAAFKGGPKNDYVVFQYWARVKQTFYLIDQVRRQMDFVETQRNLVAFCNKHPQVTTKIIESKANGDALLSSLKNVIPGMIAYNPKDSKVARISAVSPMIESGNCYIPKEAAWKEHFLLEVASFPLGNFDDVPDCMAQALLRFQKSVKKQIIFIRHEVC